MQLTEGIETKNRGNQKMKSPQLQFPDDIKDGCILEENEYEKILKSIREKVIYSIPHEMCTPLHIIIGFGEIIKEAVATNLSCEEVSEYGDEIVKSAHRLYELIEKYLMYIDIETRGSNFLMKEVQITSEYFRNIVIDIAQKYNRCNDLVVEIGTLCPKIKEDWMYFAIKELVDNAFKFSNAGQKVLIKSKETARGCEIGIYDEGRGFPPGTIERINAFEQFDRKKCEQQGVGLGLFLAKRIIERHNGILRIKSSAETGTSVFIELLYIHSKVKG